MRTSACLLLFLGVLTAEPFPRPLLDAHNCYPYEGRWADRLPRALASGFPLGIEQDLAWGIDQATGLGRPVVSHTPKTTGDEPTLRDYFFERVRPIVEAALRENKPANWPLITLHFDFKDNRPELHQAVWQLLGEYEPWITTAPKTADPNTLQPLEPKPLLVLTEHNDAQESIFFQTLPVGARLRLFGSAHSAPGRHSATTPPEQILTATPTNYRRWWNNSWYIVEEGGQRKAGPWTDADDARLRALVNHAHKKGFWIRFYTIDGFVPAGNYGWGEAYNFGSLQSAETRWKAAINAGVDLIATDQYEQLAPLLNSK